MCDSYLCWLHVSLLMQNSVSREADDTKWRSELSWNSRIVYRIAANTAAMYLWFGGTL